MVAEPTAWNREEDGETGWYGETPQFANYNTDQPYNSDIPYDLDVAVNAAQWNKLQRIATGWSMA